MNACIKSLELGQEFKSIAFPAVSSGIFKFPVEVSATAMIEAFCTWSEKFPEVPLCSIYVVVHSHAVLAFHSAIKKKFPSTFTDTMLPPVKVPLKSKVKTLSFSPSKKPVRIYDVSPSKTGITAYYYQNGSNKTDTGPATQTAAPMKLYKGELLSVKVGSFYGSMIKHMYVVTQMTEYLHEDTYSYCW